MCFFSFYFFTDTFEGWVFFVWFGFLMLRLGLPSRVLEYSVYLIRKRMLMVCSNMVLLCLGLVVGI